MGSGAGKRTPGRGNSTSKGLRRGALDAATVQEKAGEAGARGARGAPVVGDGGTGPTRWDEGGARTPSGRRRTGGRPSSHLIPFSVPPPCKPTAQTVPPAPAAAFPDQGEEGYLHNGGGEGGVWLGRVGVGFRSTAGGLQGLGFPGLLQLALWFLEVWPTTPICSRRGGGSNAAKPVSLRPHEPDLPQARPRFTSSSWGVWEPRRRRGAGRAPPHAAPPRRLTQKVPHVERRERPVSLLHRKAERGSNAPVQVAGPRPRSALRISTAARTSVIHGGSRWPKGSAPPDPCSGSTPRVWARPQRPEIDLRGGPARVPTASAHPQAMTTPCPLH